MLSSDDFLVQLIVDKGLVPEEKVEEIRSRLVNPDDLTEAPRKLVDVVIEECGLSQDQVTELLAEEFSMPMVSLKGHKASQDALRTLPRHLANRYEVFPVERQGNSLKVAISNPLDVDGIDSLSHVLQLAIEPCVASSEEIREAIIQHYGTGEATVESVLDEFSEDDKKKDSFEAQMRDDESVAESDAPIIRLVQLIINEAMKRRASDIHLEPLEKRFRLRYRIDGVLLEAEGPPKRLQLAIISRLKIMANISIAEKRIPQDGRIQVTTEGKDIDLRVSSLPTAHGESIVMRILDKEGLMLGLPELGFLSDDQATFERLISLPDGILLVTGPTGSGKTTTLYACLNYINRPDRKIITVEDPVEYQLSGINQVPVRAEVKMTFANALRSMLRQAPNIIMIGEIRDLETAEIAINASLTGHMVFSTLHTNDAPGAVTRLIDIGVKPFLVSASLRAAMAQRLVRKICPRCRGPYEPDSRELRSLNISADMTEGAKFMSGKGCTYCHGTGYRGRMGIFEVCLVTEDIQRLIYDAVSTSRLRAKAREQGMRTMREDGVRKVLAGLTTIEEVVSITVGDLD
ncbi:MAG: type II/IV secretion system protein [Puniceicoccaceae bacterium]|nr:MAG: type II/IV secretion system protein [Puniceicoccaceae bacterium]